LQGEEAARQDTSVQTTRRQNRGVSLGGIPLPNAWLGNLKHKNLVDEFGTEGGFWKLFAEGIEDINVKEGHIRIKLKE